MRHVHLIARDELNVREVGPREWESGDWYASAHHPWIGARIFLHDAKVEPSYLGGTIVSYRRLTTGSAAGRLVFRFREDATGVGVLTARCRGNWGQEKKYCR